MAEERKTEEQIKDIGCSKNLKSFQRNRYFYGKLLTVRDFEDEQRYFIEKQRLINHLLHGKGVICGLKVEKVDETTIKINPGVALDGCGREIVVPEEVKLDLSKRLSWPEEGKKDIWITLSYKACAREPVPVYSEVSSCEETCCYSRIEEGYKIEAVEEKPEDSVAYEELCSIWTNSIKARLEGKHLDLEKKAPRWVKVGEYFEVRLKVKAKYHDMKITIKPLDLEGLELDKETFPAGTFELKAGEKREFIYKVKALTRGEKKLIEGKLSVKIKGVRETETHEFPLVIINSVSHPQKERDEAFINLFQRSCLSFSEAPVVLAKVEIEKKADLIRILEIDNAILDEDFKKNLVYSNTVLYELIRCVEKQEGPPGPKGEQGPRGLRGPKGEKGEQGPPGPGLEEGLTYIRSISWKHNSRMSVDQFVRMIKNKKFSIEFSQEIRTGVDENSFILTIRTPIYHPLEGVEGWRLYHEEYIPGKIVPDNNKKKFTFTMDDKNLLYLSRYIKESLNSRTRIGVVIKCDFIIDKNGMAVAGHHLGGQGRSGLNIEGKYNLQGGIFESWFYLIPG